MANEPRELFDGNAAPFEGRRKLVEQLIIPEATPIAYYANSLLESDNRSGGQSASLSSNIFDGTAHAGANLR
jgi:hypothetical protein